MQSPDINEARILENYLIYILFSNGEAKVFDLKPYLRFKVFEALRDENELKKFSIVDGTIEWKCGADFSTDTFYIEGKQISKNAIV